MIDLPEDAEGREIPFDTKVLYGRCGNEYEVSRYCRSVRQSIPERVWEAVVPDTVTYRTSRLYPTPPDSREKLEESNYRRYYSPNGSCGTCAKPGSETCGCTAAVFNGIKKRIHKLRGEDE